MYICKIIAEIKEDFDFLREYVSKYPVLLSTSYNDGFEDNIPILIIGWSIVKNKFKKQNILDKSINKYIEWEFSKTEKEENYNVAIEKFINNSVKNWLPKEFILFDPLFQNKNFTDFISENLDVKKQSYLYFHKDALYINNNEKNFVLNIKSFKMIYENYRSIITDFINETKCLCLSYKNIANYVELDNLGCVYTFENARWVRYGIEVEDSYFNIVPGFDIKKYIPFIMSKVSNFKFSDDEKKSIRRACIRDNITQWLSSMEINLSKNFKKNGVDIKIIGESRLVKVSYSNKRTLTGRIVANSSYNPQNLDKKTQDRENIISRFNGGKIIVFDYTSFEARIALYFSEDIEFIKKFYKEDIHLHTAYIIFGNREISRENRAFAKDINNHILYGASKNTVMQKISYLSNPEEVYYNIELFLAPLLKKSNELYNLFKEKGYIINPWGTIVRPEKDFASFNNFLQSSATEIIVDQLYKIKRFLSNYKSKFLFQVHDSLVFDIHPEECIIIKDLARLIMYYNKDMFFNISYSSGYDYKNLSVPIEIIEYNCK
jgi:hypothetical protein